MSSNSKSGEVSNFYCTQCGNRGIPVYRKNGQYREPGHLKNLYCTKCKVETNHCEIRPFGSKYTYDDFKMEFELGRFTKEGKRIPSNELIKCSKINCKYNVGENCWNGNYSYTCKHRR